MTILTTWLDTAWSASAWLGRAGSAPAWLDPTWLALDLRPWAWALIHFLWQGSIVALLLAGALRMMSRADARIRYALCCLALATMAALPVLTGVVMESPSSGALSPASTGPAPGGVDIALGWTLLAWSLGVVLVGVRHVRAWLGLRRWVRTRTTSVTGPVSRRFQQLADSMNIGRPVRLLASLHVDVPSTLGSLRPVVVVPASLLTGLPAAQLNALLVHEFAHVRRWDYAVNLFQIFVETVLFYHPAVWWVSRQIRIERESCCDDVAVALCKDRRAYVEALTTLETMRGTTMAMSANGGSLLARVRRLLGDGRHEASTGSIGAILALALLLAGLTVAVNACEGTTPSDENNAQTMTAPADGVSADAVSADAAAEDAGPTVMRFVDENGKTIELQRPEGMTGAEFKKHIQENWEAIEGAEGAAAGDPGDNTFVIDSQTRERFVDELVRRGIVEEGDPIELQFQDGILSVNGKSVDPKDLGELKVILHGPHGDEAAVLEPVEGWVEKEHD